MAAVGGVGGLTEPMLWPDAPRSDSRRESSATARMRRTAQRMQILSPAKRASAQPSAQQILPRGTIPLYDESAYDEAMKHGEERPRIWAPYFATIVGDINLAQTAASMTPEHWLKWYRTNLHGAKPHGGKSVTALAIERVLEAPVAGGGGDEHVPFSDWIISGGVDGSIAVHDAATGGLRARRLNAHGVSTVLCVAVVTCARTGHKQLLSGGLDGSLCHWRLADLHALGELEANHGGRPIMCIAVSPREAVGPAAFGGGPAQRFVTIGQDTRAISWLATSTADGLVFTLEFSCRIGAPAPHASAPYEVTSAAWLDAPDEHDDWREPRCFAADTRGRVLVWSVEDMRATHAPTPVSAAASAAAGDGLSAELRLREVRATDADGTSAHELGAAVRGMAASPDGELLLVDDLGRISSYRVEARRAKALRPAPLPPTPGGAPRHPRPFSAAPLLRSPAPRGGGDGADGEAELLFEVRHQARVERAHGLIGREARFEVPHAVFAVACAPDGALLLSGGDDGVIRRWSYGPGALKVVVMPGAVRGFDGEPLERDHFAALPRLLRTTSGRASPRAYAPTRDTSWLPWGQQTSLVVDNGAVNVVVHWANVKEPNARYHGMLFSAGTDGLLSQWHFDDSASLGPQLALCATVRVPRLPASRAALPDGLPPAVPSDERAGVFASHPPPSPARSPLERAPAGAERGASRISVRCAQLSPDGSRLFCGNADGSLYAFRIEARERALVLAEQPDVVHSRPHGDSPVSGKPLPIAAMAVLPRGWRGGGPVLLTCAEHGARRVLAWDVASCARLRVEISPFEGSLSALAFVSDARDGRCVLVAAGPSPSSLSVWTAELRDAADGGVAGGGGGGAPGSEAAGPPGGSEPLGRLELSLASALKLAHAGSEVKAVAVSPDGLGLAQRRVLSGGADGHAHVWSLDLEALRLVRLGYAIPSAHTKLCVNALAFTPAPGKHLLSGGTDGALRAWPKKWCVRADATIQPFEPALVDKPTHARGGARLGDGADDDDDDDDDDDAATAGADADALRRRPSQRSWSARLPPPLPPPRMACELVFLGGGTTRPGPPHVLHTKLVFLGANGDATGGDAAARRPRVDAAAIELARVGGAGGRRGSAAEWPRTHAAAADARSLFAALSRSARAGGDGGGGAGGARGGAHELYAEPAEPWAEEDEDEGGGGAHAVAAPPLLPSAAPSALARVLDSVSFLWPSRLACNSPALVLTAVLSGNRRVLHRLLCLAAACDWGDPYALFDSRASPRFAALHAAIRLGDRASVRLLLAYVVQLKRKAQCASAVLHVEDCLLLLERYPYILARFLAALGLERVHPHVAVRRAYESSAHWVLRSARSLSPALDRALQAAGVLLCVPQHGFLTKTAHARDPPGLWARQHVAADSDTRQTSQVRALRVGVRDAFACRELLPLLVASRARAQLLRTPAVIALVDAKWHAYGCSLWLLEYLFLGVYVGAFTSFLVLCVMRDTEWVVVGGVAIELKHVQDTATLAAKLVTSLNSLFLMRELTVWRLATRATGALGAYWQDAAAFFNWSVALSTLVATTLYLRCSDAGRPRDALAPAVCVSGHHPSTSSAAAVGMVMLGFRALTAVRVLPEMAEIVNMVIRVVYELYHFVLVMLLIIVSFGLALYVRLSDRSRQWWESPSEPRPCEWQSAADGSSPPACEVVDEFASLRRVFLFAWGMLLGEVDVGQFDADAVDTLLFFGFTFLLSVLMLNLIIAVIADHHLQVKQLGDYAWREALASTVASTDLLQLWWSTERTGASQAVPWRRLPVDASDDAPADGDDDDDDGARAPADRWVPVDCERGLSALTHALLELGALVGGGCGAACGAALARTVGARSTGVATAMPVAFAACAVFHAAAQPLYARVAAAAGGGASAPAPAEPAAAEPAARREPRGVAEIGCDMSILTAAAGGLLGAFAGFDLDHWLPMALPSAPRVVSALQVDCALGACLTLLVRALFRAGGLSARGAFHGLSNSLVALLALVVGTSLGAVVGFWTADVTHFEHNRVFMADGAGIGGLLALVCTCAAALGGRDGLAAALCAFSSWWFNAPLRRGLRVDGSGRLADVAALLAPALAALFALGASVLDLLARVSLADEPRWAGAKPRSRGTLRERAARRLPVECGRMLALGVLAAAGSAAGLLGDRLFETAGYLPGLEVTHGALTAGAAVVLALAAHRLAASCGAAAEVPDSSAQRERAARKWVFALEDVHCSHLGSDNNAHSLGM